jgi:hypothetical protein
MLSITPNVSSVQRVINQVIPCIGMTGQRQLQAEQQAESNPTLQHYMISIKANAGSHY